MKLVLLHGPVASGKLTIGRALAQRTGFALFHNHLVVDAVAALFPFGSEPFCRLREALWLSLLNEAARADRDAIFTYAPEPTVHPGFIERLIGEVEAAGATVLIVALSVDTAEQERRLTAPDRAAFGKLRDRALLQSLRPAMAACATAMPTPDLMLDTTMLSPEATAGRIAKLLD